MAERVPLSKTSSSEFALEEDAYVFCLDRQLKIDQVFRLRSAPIDFDFLRREANVSAWSKIKIVGVSSILHNPVFSRIPAMYELFVRARGTRIVVIPTEGRICVERTAQIPAPELNRNSRSEHAVASGSLPPKKVLIIDDSKTIRDLLDKLLTREADFEVVGKASCPSEALEILKTVSPDLITLDIHMPEMNGVELLKRYYPTRPIPTVLITSMSKDAGPEVLEGLSAGAIDYIQKPSFQTLVDEAPLILEKLRAAASVKPRRQMPIHMSRMQLARGSLDLSHLIAIGSSTGGTEALKNLFMGMPEEIPPILVVQHIPAVFSRAFADRLNTLLPFEVKEAEDGDEVLANRVLIAPGGLQMELTKNGKVRVFDGAPVNRHKPSVDVLFQSVSKLMGKNAVGVILTGMGNDGAAGLLEMKKSGAPTIGQDEASCVVYGMPQAAFQLGAVDKQLPLDKIPEGIIAALGRKKFKAA